MGTANATKIDDFTAYYRVNQHPQGGHWLERVTSQRPIWDHPWPEDAKVRVTVTVFEQQGQLFAGDVSVSTVPEPLDLRELRMVIQPPTVDPLPIGSELWRMIPTKLFREAVEYMFTEDAHHLAALISEEDPEPLERLTEATKSRRRRRPGRPSAITPELMAEAARAYRAAGPRGVQAARTALESAGFAGSGPNGEVTRDQAKKVVAMAREKGLLPEIDRS